MRTMVGIILGVGLTAAPALGQSLVPAPTFGMLDVCLEVSTGFVLPESAATVMLREADTIWQPYGVRLRRLTGDEGACDRRILIKDGAEAPPGEEAVASALGWVPFVAGRARRLVYLRLARTRSQIAAMSRGSRPEGLNLHLMAKFLGRGLAHEIGHILLNSRDHAPRGLMRARFQPTDVLDTPLATYSLTRAEQVQIFGAPTLIAQRESR